MQNPGVFQRPPSYRHFGAEPPGTVGGECEAVLKGAGVMRCPPMSFPGASGRAPAMTVIVRAMKAEE